MASFAAFHNPAAMYFLKATDGNFYGCYRSPSQTEGKYLCCHSQRSSMPAPSTWGQWGNGMRQHSRFIKEGIWDSISYSSGH